MYKIMPFIVSSSQLLMYVLAMSIIKVLHCMTSAFDDPLGAKQAIDPHRTASMDPCGTDADFRSWRKETGREEKGSKSQGSWQG